MIDLLHQFLITRWINYSIAGVDLSFTNASFFMLLSVGLIIGLFAGVNRSKQQIPGRLRSLVEILYTKVYEVVEGYLGENTRSFFPYIFCLFLFIIFSNSVGLLPGTFTTTSHIVVAGTLAISIFLVSIIVGIAKHRLAFLKIIVPNDVPWYILPLIIPIEILSFFSRPISLSVRLFANMVSGHIMIKLFAAFTAILAMNGLVGIVGSALPLAMNIAFFGFELFVACIQAYIFTVLTCVYIKSSIELH